MQADIKLGRIWNIPIGLNNSWLIIFGLITFSLATGFYAFEFPRSPALVDWTLALLTSILFFSSVLLHELGHAYAALRSGIGVRGITLFIFGGIAQIERDSRTPGEEFRIAIAGPIVSFALALLFGALSTFSEAMPYLASMAGWLAGVNLSLALFNLIPGYPLDGGRVLKAIVWQLTGDGYRATNVAAFGGRLVAFGFIGFGLWTMFSGSFFNGFWLGLIGWFLLNAANSSVQQAQLQRSLDGVRVSAVMNHERPWLPGWLTLQQVVDTHVLRDGLHYFFVGDGQGLKGLLTLKEVTAVPRVQWNSTTAEQVMTPWADVTHVEAERDLFSALQVMESAQVEHLPVTENGHVVGMLTRDNVLRHLRLRTQLGI